MKSLIPVCLTLVLLIAGTSRLSAEDSAKPLDYEVDLRVVTEGFDGKTCWVQCSML